MTSPLAIVFGKTRPKQMDFDRPEGCDHDQSVYHYRLVDGAMVLRGIALGPRWESRPMDWRGLSCYKRKEDEQMALITKESGRPEARKDKDEIMAKAKEMMREGSTTVKEVSEKLGVPMGTLYGWLAKEKKRVEKVQAVLESVDAGKPVTNYGGPVDLINLTIDDCHKITKRLFGDRLTENKDGTVNIGPPVRSMGCIEPEPELQYEATEVITAPIGVEVPQYDPSDNDFADDDEPIPYVVKPEPIDAQIDIMIDLYLADRKAKLKAHLKSLMADPEVMDAIKAMIGMGLIA